MRSVKYGAGHAHLINHGTDFHFLCGVEGEATGGV